MYNYNKREREGEEREREVQSICVVLDHSGCISHVDPLLQSGEPGSPDISRCPLPDLLLESLRDILRVSLHPYLQNLTRVCCYCNCNVNSPTAADTMWCRSFVNREKNPCFAYGPLNS